MKELKNIAKMDVRMFTSKRDFSTFNEFEQDAREQIMELIEKDDDTGDKFPPLLLFIWNRSLKHSTLVVMMGADEQMDKNMYLDMIKEPLRQYIQDHGQIDSLISVISSTMKSYSTENGEPDFSKPPDKVEDVLTVQTERTQGQNFTWTYSFTTKKVSDNIMDDDGQPRGRFVGLLDNLAVDPRMKTYVVGGETYEKRLEEEKKLLRKLLQS